MAIVANTKCWWEPVSCFHTIFWLENCVESWDTLSWPPGFNFSVHTHYICKLFSDSMYLEKGTKWIKRREKKTILIRHVSSCDGFIKTPLIKSFKGWSTLTKNSFSTCPFYIYIKSNCLLHNWLGHYPTLFKTHYI